MLTHYNSCASIAVIAQKHEFVCLNIKFQISLSFSLSSFAQCGSEHTC